jgi:hypothetical protein
MPEPHVLGTTSSRFNITTRSKRLSRETDNGHDVSDYITELCQVVVKQDCCRIPGLWVAYEPVDEIDFNIHVYVTAIHTQTIPVV